MLVDRPPAARRPGPVGSSPLPWLKPGIFFGALAPLGSLALRAAQGALGANPIAQAINELGLTALILLIASLACTPARQLLGWTWAMRIRRELGLFAFFYATLHFLIYVVVDQGLDLGIIVEDIVERPFITVGFLALVLLVPLAFTSTPTSVRRLGYQRWLRLHRLVYLAGLLAVVHFIWRVKIDISQPLTYAVILVGLLTVRLVLWLARRSAGRSSPARFSQGRPGPP